MRKIKPATKVQVWQVERSYEYVRLAVNMLTKAGALKAAAAVRRSVKSVEGARRHIYHRWNRQERGE